METQMGCNLTIMTRLVKPACIHTVYIPIENVRKGLRLNSRERYNLRSLLLVVTGGTRAHVQNEKTGTS